MSSNMEGGSAIADSRPYPVFLSTINTTCRQCCQEYCTSLELAYARRINNHRVPPLIRMSIQHPIVEDPPLTQTDSPLPTQFR